MRQIKFRAWDIENKKMSKPFNFEDVMSDGGYGDLYNAKIHDDIDAYEVHDDKKYSLMQFTGLKDKNGKEIYEGDIVDKKFKWKIVFRSGAFYGKSDISINAPRLLKNLIKLRKKALIPIEIIGNIHENKELLK